MKILSGHISFLDFEVECPQCKRTLTYQISAVPVKDFPKRIKFSCKQLACSKEWFKIVDLSLSPIEYDYGKYKSLGRRLKDFLFG